MEIYNPVFDSLTESSKSPASIAKSNKQWVGTCLYQEECKLLLINCGTVIRLPLNQSSFSLYPYWIEFMIFGSTAKAVSFETAFCTRSIKVTIYCMGNMIGIRKMVIMASMIAKGVPHFK